MQRIKTGIKNSHDELYPSEREELDHLRAEKEKSKMGQQSEQLRRGAVYAAYIYKEEAFVFYPKVGTPYERHIDDFDKFSEPERLAALAELRKYPKWLAMKNRACQEKCHPLKEPQIKKEKQVVPCQCVEGTVCDGCNRYYPRAHHQTYTDRVVPKHHAPNYRPCCCYRGCYCRGCASPYKEGDMYC